MIVTKPTLKMVGSMRVYAPGCILNSKNNGDKKLKRHKSLKNNDTGGRVFFGVVDITPVRKK
jgi:hypothetical protein